MKICITKILSVAIGFADVRGALTAGQLGLTRAPLHCGCATPRTRRVVRMSLLTDRVPSGRLVVAGLWTLAWQNLLPKTLTRDSAGGRLSTPAAAAPYADTPCAHLNKQNPGHT